MIRTWPAPATDHLDELLDGLEDALIFEAAPRLVLPAVGAQFLTNAPRPVVL